MKINRLYLLVVLLAVCGFLSACGSTTWKSESNTPSYENRKLWKTYLKVKHATADQPINTTTTHISNVSHEIAVNKINQALQNYTVDLGYKLSTVFQLATQDEVEGETKEAKEGEQQVKEPAVTAMSVQGHLYYIGFLDFPDSTNSLAMFYHVSGLIPAIAVVDGEDESKPVWIRTSDEDGQPYKIKLHFTVQTTGNYDDNNIYRHLRNRGYSTALSCNGIDNPKLELDDKWRPYFVVTYNAYDACAFTNGTMEHPVDLLIVDAQTGEIKSLKLDDPTTGQNERDPEIDKTYGWIDQIYSPKVIRQWVDAWGYNPLNYGKTSTVDQFHMDGSHVDEVMNYTNTNIEFVSYIVSAHPDDSLIGIMCIDPRTGEAILYDTQGPKAMATKSLAMHLISETVNPLVIPHGIEYEVEGLTLHTIYGEPTWQGQLTKPAYDNNGNRYGSIYYGAVFLRADDDLISENVAWAESKHEAMTKYQKVLFLKQSDRIGSNVLEVKEIKGNVTSIKTVVTGGETTYLVKLEGSDHQWEVPIEYVGDPLTEDIFDAAVGDEVYMKFADVHNRKTHLTREFRDLTKGEQSALHQKPSADNK
jgi:hypothetical protein